VPGRQPADHEQAELVAVGQVELRRLSEPLVERAQRRVRDAEPAVLDLDDVAVGDPAGPDLHAGVRRGVQHGVLDQLGQQVRHVRHGGTDDEVT
jgi:hypothetical protein